MIVSTADATLSRVDERDAIRLKMTACFQPPCGLIAAPFAERARREIDDLLSRREARTDRRRSAQTGDFDRPLVNTAIPNDEDGPPRIAMYQRACGHEERIVLPDTDERGGDARRNAQK
jgi:hypothetical protein